MAPEKEMTKADKITLMLKWLTEMEAQGHPHVGKIIKGVKALDDGGGSNPPPGKDKPHQP